MGVFTEKSKIEFFRIRRHGITSRFRFLKDGQAGYLIIGELVSDFYVNRRFDTNVGAHVETLVFDAPPNFNLGIIGAATFGDLVKPDGGNRRFTISTETAPTASVENRFRLRITAAFNDRTPIYGIASPDPEDTGEPFGDAPRYIHHQTVASTLWIVNHNLNQSVVAQVWDSEGEMIFSPQISEFSKNQIRVAFNVPMTGEVRVL